MSTLLMTLAAPLQSWGDSSRFSRRETRHAPTKSGVVGLLAAAGGRGRTDSVEDLAGLRFGVRMDQPGRLVRDFQTARPAKAEHSGLSQRYYLSDAAFLVGVEGDTEFLSALVQSLRTPSFPLFLGRRSCPPARPLAPRLVSTGLVQSLMDAEWLAATWYRRRQPRGEVRLRLLVDVDDAPSGSARGSGVGSAASSEPDGGTRDLALETVRDLPVSYDSRRRQYGWRQVAELSPVVVANPEGRAGGGGVDWFVEAQEA